MVADTPLLSHDHPVEISEDEHVAVMADLFAMLGDESRLRILMHLRVSDEVCVSDLAAAVGLSESAVSHALRLLRAHGIVEARRDGRWMHYTLRDEHVRVLLDATLDHLARDHR